MSDQNFTRLEDSFSRAVCHDCMVEFTVGWDEANPEPCDYCYEVTEVYRITFRGKVLAKFHGEEPGVYEAAWAKYDELAATRKGVKMEATTGAVSRCENHPYEG